LENVSFFLLIQRDRQIKTSSKMAIGWWQIFINFYHKKKLNVTEIFKQVYLLGLIDQNATLTRMVFHWLFASFFVKYFLR
jgi:hypothetical protein